MNDSNQNKNEIGLESETIQKNLEHITNAKSNPKSPREGVHTFASDIAGEVKDKNMSVIKIALAEQRRQEEYATVMKKSKTQKIIYILMAGIFIIGGVALIANSLNQRDQQVPIPQTQQQKVNSLLFSDNQTTIDVTRFSRTEFIQAFKQKNSFTSEGVTNIIAIIESGDTFRALSGAEFVDLVGQNAPEGIGDFLQYDYMMGLYQEGETKEPFLVFRFDSFDSFVLYMREWEPFLLEDTVSFFSISTLGLGSGIYSKNFSSEILLNKESRILRDDNQNFVLGYTFLDRKTVVITRSKQTLTELIERYANQAIQ